MTVHATRPFSIATSAGSCWSPNARVSVPARNVNVAVPAAPLTTVTVATCDPAAIVTGPDTLAMLGSLLVTVTVVAVAAGFESSVTPNTDWLPGAE